MIRVENLHKYYGSNHVLKGISFSVPKGQITGLVGPNGSGKSTTIRVLTGFNESDGGEVTVEGQAMNVQSVETKRLVGYAPESAPSYRENTVSEYLRFVAKLRGVAKGGLDAEIDRVIAAFSLQKVLNQAIGTLSKGYRHRVSLAQSILGDPPVVILDEPTDGLDPIQKVSTRKMIQQLAQSKAVLLTTHLLEEVELLCDRVVAIQQGEIVYEGRLAGFSESQREQRFLDLRIAGDDSDALERLVATVSTIQLESLERSEGCLSATLSSLAKSDIDLCDLVSSALFSEGFRVIELTEQQRSLNEIYSAYSVLEGH